MQILTNDKNKEHTRIYYWAQALPDLIPAMEGRLQFNSI